MQRHVRPSFVGQCLRMRDARFGQRAIAGGRAAEHPLVAAGKGVQQGGQVGGKGDQRLSSLKLSLAAKLDRLL